MKVDFGTGVVLGMAVLFYVRYLLVKREKTRSDAGIGIHTQPSYPNQTVRFTNAVLVTLGIVLLVVGAFFNVTSGLPSILQSGWWAPVALGLFFLILVIH